MKSKFVKPVALFAVSTLAFILTTITGCIRDADDNNMQLIKELESTTYLTEHYPPLNYEQEGLLYGLSVDILEELFKKMNVNRSRKDIILKNWSEAYHQALNEEHTMLFSLRGFPKGKQSLNGPGLLPL